MLQQWLSGYAIKNCTLSDPALDGIRWVTAVAFNSNYYTFKRYHEYFNKWNTFWLHSGLAKRFNQDSLNVSFHGFSTSQLATRTVLNELRLNSPICNQLFDLLKTRPNRLDEEHSYLYMRLHGKIESPLLALHVFWSARRWESIFPCSLIYK